jgi:hypothetical protein
MAVIDRRDGVAGDIVTTDRRGGIADNVAIKRACLVAAATNITLAGLQSIDGVTLVAGDRVLVMGQTTAAQNGIYDASSGNWTRSADADGNTEWQYGTLVFVVSGTNYARSWWYLATTGDITVGTTSLTFTQTTLETFLQAGTGAVSRTYLAKARENLSVLDFIPVAEHAAIQAYTSTTDLSTYIAAAITALGSRYGTLFFPRGRYSIASAINADNLRNVIFQGEGGHDLTYAGTSGTVIRFTGTGSGSIVTMADHRGVWWRDIQVVYTSNSFTGTFFNCATTFQTGCASGFENVQCYQITSNGHTAGQCWYLKNNVDVTFRNCYASHASYGWVGLFTTDAGPNTNETNVIKLYGCTSIALGSAAIVNPIIGWTLYSHNFELGDGGVPAGILSTSTFEIKNLNLYGCIFADSTANGTWINLPNNVFGFTMHGGLLYAASGTVTGILIGSSFSAGIHISGVTFSGLSVGINFAASTTGAIWEGNNFLTVTTPVSGGSNLDDGSFGRGNNPATANRNGSIPALDTTNTFTGTFIAVSNSQNAQTTIFSTNTNAGASAKAAFTATSNAGSAELVAASTAGGAGAGLTWSGSGGLSINQANAAGDIVFSTTGSFTERLRIASGGAVTVGGNLSPKTTDGASLGTTVLQWSDLFLASGGVINWNNGDTLTHSSGALTANTTIGTSKAATVAPAFDTENIPTVSVTNGGNSSIIIFGAAAIVTIVNQSTFSAAVYLCGGGQPLTLLGQTASDFVAPTTTPAGGKASFAYDGVAGGRIYNNLGSTTSFRPATWKLN